MAAITGLRRAIRASIVVSLVAGASACGMLPGVATDSAAARDAAIVMGMGCERADTFAFFGETTLSAIGLGAVAGGPDAERVGTIVVTADAVNPGPGGGPGPAVQLQRIVCVQFADGSGTATGVPDDWQPPGGLVAADGSPEAAGPPLVLIGLVIAALLLGGVSLLAFRAPERP